jgi:DNA-binding CsgD family transcriptional regulator
MERPMRLSNRQGQVVDLVARGLSDKEIATRLGLAVPTVKTYLSRLYRYYGFRNRVEAAVAWGDASKLVLTRPERWHSVEEVKRHSYRV